MVSNLAEVVDGACSPWTPGKAGGLSTRFRMKINSQDRDALADVQLGSLACRY